MVPFVLSTFSFMPLIAATTTVEKRCTTAKAHEVKDYESRLTRNDPAYSDYNLHHPLLNRTRPSTSNAFINQATVTALPPPPLPVLSPHSNPAAIADIAWPPRAAAPSPLCAPWRPCRPSPAKTATQNQRNQYRHHEGKGQVAPRRTACMKTRKRSRRLLHSSANAQHILGTSTTHLHLQRVHRAGGVPEVRLGL